MARVTILGLLAAALLCACSSPPPSALPPAPALRTVDVTGPAVSGAVVACAGVAVLGGTLRGDASDPRVAWLDLGPNGTRGLVFPQGFTARFTPRLEVLDATGRVVFRDGDPITGGCVGDDDSLLIGWP